jgi:hypothetical protein
MIFENRLILLNYPHNQQLPLLNFSEGNQDLKYKLIVYLIRNKLSNDGNMIFKGAARAAPFFIMIYFLGCL